MSFKVFVPSHITGFFNIENNSNLLKNGSCGAGFLLDKGVITSIKSSKNDDISIKINGNVDLKNETIIREVLNILGIDSGLKITQTIQVPIGAGFGTSASSALGVAIGVNEVLNLGNEFTKSGQIAHLAEINLGTGLGDVIAEMSKGIVLRVKAGAPGYGEVIFNNNEDIYIACKTFGEISTSRIINDPYYKKIINSKGLSLKDRLLDDFSLKNFLNLSYEFASGTSLIKEDVSNLIKTFLSDEDVLGSSMAMLGNTAFAFSYYKETFNDLAIDIYKLDNEGIKLC